MSEAKRVTRSDDGAESRRRKRPGMEHPTDYRALYETVNELRHQEREEMKALTRKLADAQATVDALQRERDKLREATKVICGHCCEPMAIPSKAILQSQLSALQGLVRVYFTEPDPHTWTAAYQTLKRMGRALPATPTERGQG